MCSPLSKYFSFFKDTQPSIGETLPPSNRKRACLPPRAPVNLYPRLCLYSCADVKRPCYCFSRTKVPQIRESRRRLASCFESRIDVLSCRLSATIGSHQPVLTALWQEAWPPGVVGWWWWWWGCLAVNIVVVAVKVGDVLCGEWLLCVCVCLDAHKCARV